MKENRTLSLSEITRHWLLNTAIEFGVPLTHVFPEVSQALNVKPVLGCGSVEYARGLMELFDSRMITFHSDVEGDYTENRIGILKVLERFRSLSENPALQLDGRPLKSLQRSRLPGMQVYFKLTALGGETWKGIAQPDWMRYISVSSDMTSGDLVSPNRDLLFAYLGWFSELQGEQVVRESINWQTHTDFEIVYWKRMPFVYHAPFQVQSADRYWPEPRWFRECRNSLQSWYTKPWELPDWPSL